MDMRSPRSILVGLILAAEPFAPRDVVSRPIGGDDPHAVVRGMTISCAGAGLSWGSDAMVDTMEELRDLGVNWVTIHPYGGIREDGTVGRSGIDRLLEDPWWLRRAIREAHALGLKIMIKPHLAYWGTSFGWRGDITFTTDEEWQRFFDTYETWIEKIAGLSGHADAFVVGTELDQTTYREEPWRSIIAAVRARTPAPLTYSASWNAYRDVPFWDALDVIAIQAYFPLVEHEDEPSQAELDRAWGGLATRLEAFGRARERKVVFGELGYNRSRFAAVRPWAYRQHADPVAETIQRRCLGAALRAIDDSDVIAGAFLWKWFPGEFERSNFVMSTPAMRDVIRRHWTGEHGTH